MRSITGVRAGRPDYSTTTTFSITPPQPAGILTIYVNNLDDIPATTERYYVPTDSSGNTFPREGKSLRVKSVIVSGDADTMLYVALVHVDGDDWQAYQQGRISLVEMLERSTYFYRDKGYQRIACDIEFYPINYPDILLYAVYNASSDTRRVAITLKMEEHPYYVPVTVVRRE